MKSILAIVTTLLMAVPTLSHACYAPECGCPTPNPDKCRGISADIMSAISGNSVADSSLSTAPPSGEFYEIIDLNGITESQARSIALQDANQQCGGAAQLVSDWSLGSRITQGSCPGGPQNPGNHPCTISVVTVSGEFVCE